MVGRISHYPLLLSLLASSVLRVAVANSDASPSSRSIPQVNDNEADGSEGTRELLDFNSLLPNDEDTLFGEEAVATSTTEEDGDESSTTEDGSLSEIVANGNGEAAEDNQDVSQSEQTPSPSEMQAPEEVEDDNQGTAAGDIATVQAPDLEVPDGASTAETSTEIANEDNLVPVPDTSPNPGDFEEFNDLLANTVIQLGDADISEDLLFQPITVSMRNLECSQISFTDIMLDSDERTNQIVSIEFALTDLAIVCEFDFRWSYIFLSGSGHANVEVGDSSVNAAMDLISDDFQTLPPANATIKSCNTDINILGLEFSGNIASQIFNVFEDSIIQVLDEELNAKICVEFKGVGDDLITESLSMGLSFLEPFLEPMEAWRSNISFPELSMEVPDDVELVSWTEEDGGIGEFLAGALDYIDETMGSLVEDDSREYTTPLFFPNGTQYPDGYDLGVNTLLRKYLLDDARAFSLEEEIVLYEGIDVFTETTLKLTQVKIVGLDTLTQFEPFTRVGNFTLQNAASWESLSLEAVLKMEVKASPLENSIIRDPERVDPYVEEMTVSVGVDDLVTDISMMVAFDPMKTAGVQIGSVLDLMSMLPCMAASLHDFALAGLNVSIGNIQLPTVEGLVSKGVDRLLIDAMDLGFYMLRGPLMEAIPSFFETFVRDMVNDMFQEIQCPEFILPELDSMVDLRDLILSPAEAEVAGASGKAQYGDLAHTFYGIGQTLWQEVNSDGTLGLNDFLISPFTKATSEESGLLRFPDRLYNFTTEGYDQLEFKTLVTRFEFALYDLHIDNLDTVVHPMALLEPVDHPYITQSTINMGPLEERLLNVSINMLMALDIEDSPLAMNNVINLGFSVASVEFFFELMTMLSTTKMLNFLFIDFLRFDCMLNMMPRPEMNETGYAIGDGGDKGLQIRKLLARVSDLKLAINCIECSPGVASLPEMVDIFDKHKVTDILGYRIPMFAEEIAISDALHANFDRWIYEAPYYCPSHEEYNEDYLRPEEWKTPEFSDLSVEASDTIFFTSFALAEVALVLLSETHYPWNLSTLDPLYTQNAYIPKEGSDLFDWTNLSEDFDLLADDARRYLGEFRMHEASNISDLGINHLVRDFLVDENGVLEIMDFVPEGSFEFSVEGVVILFHSIKLRGLDTFTRFDVLKPIAPQTILNSMHLRQLEIEVIVSAGSRTDPPQLIVANLDFGDLNATVPLFAAIDMNKLNELDLGHFLNTQRIFDCLLAVTDSISFPQFLMMIGNFSVPTFEGFLPESGDALMNSVRDVYEKYAARALKALPVVFDVTARQFVNTYIADYIDWATCTHLVEDAQNKTPPGQTPYPFTDFVDLRELILRKVRAAEYGALGNNTYGDLFLSLLYPLQEDILWVNPETNLSTNLNYALQTATSLLFGENGTLAVPGKLIEPLELVAEIGALKANVSFGLSDLRFENLDTMGNPLSFLNPLPENSFELSNSVGAGLGGRPLRVSMLVSLNLALVNGDTGLVEQDIVNNMIITLEMEEFRVLFRLFAQISESRLIHFPMADILNPSCWLALMPAPDLDKRGIRLEGESSYLAFRDVMAAVENLNLTITCANCSSPGMENLIEALAKPESQVAVTGLANTLFRFGEELTGGNLVQDALDRAVFDAGRYCPHDPKYDPDAQSVRYTSLNFDRTVGTSSLLLMLITVGFSFIMVMLAVTIVVKWVVHRRHRRWIRTLPAMKVHILEHQQDADEQMENELNHDTSAMITTSEIPKKVRYGMPILILGNIAFFLSGHISIAAETAFEAKVAGESFTLDRFFAFSIMKSTVDMWEAGATEMAIFILIFSGIWPYVKQLISLFCWFCPPTMLSISTRGSTFLWLDTLAKWSMVDIFVMFVSMVSFRVNAITPDVPYLPEDFFSLSLIIIPRWGLYANLIAQLISQVSSHYIIHYHRAIVRRASRKYVARHKAENKPLSVLTAEEDDHSGNTDEDKGIVDGNKDRQSRLCDGAFARPHKGESSKLVARQIASYGLVVGTFLLIVFFMIGCSLPSLNVQIQGVISFVSGAGDGVYKEFNVWGVAKQLMRDAVELGGFQIAGYLLLSIVFITTICVVPVLQAFALACHWFRPMNDKQRKTFSNIIEILAAWQYAEVFILALIVSSWQLAPTSETIMADQCSEFEDFFGVLAYYGVLQFRDSHCYRVEATIMNGAYFLASGAVLLAILNSFVMKASYQYYWDKDCCRKEMAVRNHLTPEEAATPVDEDILKGIHPPPVLFSDTFRWLLRPEHLGDLPLQGIVVEEQSFVIPKDGREENISTESSVGHDVQESSSSESYVANDKATVDC